MNSKHTLKHLYNAKGPEVIQAFCYVATKMCQIITCKQTPS